MDIMLLAIKCEPLFLARPIKWEKGKLILRDSVVWHQLKVGGMGCKGVWGGQPVLWLFSALIGGECIWPQTKLWPED